MVGTIHLSEWIDWKRRNELPSEIGIYVIAKGSTKNVIYVGRTWGVGGIRNRVQAFNRSATTGQDGHAGGVTYNKVFGSSVLDLHVTQNVPRAINPDPAIVRPYIEYAERRLLWEHIEQFGSLPTCNSQ